MEGLYKTYQILFCVDYFWLVSCEICNVLRKVVPKHQSKNTKKKSEPFIKEHERNEADVSTVKKERNEVHETS